MTNKLTIFYDANCPLCTLEMQKLKQHDAQNMIVLINLHSESLALSHPYINKEKAMAMLHGEYNGDILLALDVTHKAWSLVGKGFWVAPLQFRLIKPIAHYVYLFMAKHRHTISKALFRYFNIGIKNCSTGACNATQRNTDHWRKQ